MIYLILNNITYYLSRFFAAVFFCFLVYCIYFFSLPHAHIGNYTLNNPFQPFISNLNTWLYLLIYAIAISIFNTIALIVMSMYFTVKNEKFEKARLSDQLFFIEKIFGYIHSGDRNDLVRLRHYFSSFQRRLSKRQTIESFFTDIISIQENIDDDLSGKFRKIFISIGLVKYIPVFLYSKKLDKRIIALKIIGCLKLAGYEDMIKKYAQSKNYVLRTVALYTLIKLSETKNLDEILAHDHQISLLDINVIVHGIENNYKAEINYPGLLESHSNSIRVAGLLLVKIRNRVEYKSQVRALVNSDDVLLKETALEVFISFADCDDDSRFLIDKYGSGSEKNKLQILKGLKLIDNEDFYAFLSNVITTDEIILKLEALRILFRYNLDRFLVFENSGDESIEAAYNEIADLNLG